MSRDHAQRPAQAAATPASATPQAGSAAAVAQATCAFLRGGTDLTSPVLVGLHQALIDPILVGRVVTAWRQGASLGRNLPAELGAAQMVHDPRFDWGVSEPAGTAGPPALTPDREAVTAAPPPSPGAAAPPGEVATPATTSLTQGTLAEDLRSAAQAHPVDADRLVARIEAAPLVEVTSLAKNADLVRQMERSLPSRVRGRLARRLFPDGQRAVDAWALIASHDRAQRQRLLDAYGAVAEQRALCDAVIAKGSHVDFMVEAFASYWNVEMSSVQGQHWNAELLQRVHSQCKLLPEQDVRGGAWRRLTLTRGEGGSMSDHSGEFAIGSGSSMGGLRTRLTSGASFGALFVRVENPGAFPPHSQISIGGHDMKTLRGVVLGNSYILDSGLSRDYPAGTEITPATTTGENSSLTERAKAGTREIQVANLGPFSIGLAIELGPAPSADVHQVAEIDPVGKKLKFRAGLHHTYPVGARVAPIVAHPFGIGTALAQAVEAGATHIYLSDLTQFQVGARIGLGPRPSADIKQITAIEEAYLKLTLNSPLSHGYPRGALVAPDDGTAMRLGDWTSAVVRHEIGHAVDAMIRATGFYALGGWEATRDFSAWAAAMGNPWQTSDGSVISSQDRQAIQAHISAAARNSTPRALNHGLPRSHAINRYYGKEVPVIEAAKPCILRGESFWTTPQDLKRYGSRYFSINTYYGRFQYHNEEVMAQRVRAYQLYSPAEFFAEIYTVFYEEAGRVPEEQLGRLVPVGAWRDWIRNHVHQRGHAPGAASPSGAGVGAKTHNPGM